MISYPSDWEEMTLSEFTEINPNTEIPNEFNYVDLESVKDVFLLKTRKEKKCSAPSRAKRYAKKGDVFFQTVRPYQRNNYIFKLEGDYVFSTGYAQLRTTNNSDFLFYLIRHDKFVNDVLDNCTGTSYPAINPTSLAKIQIYVPPLPEQRAIADTLATFDTHIKNLSEIIEKKKAIRDGALDDLMSGRTRLKGFSGDWDTYKFDNIFKIIPNNVLSRDKLTTRGNIGNIHYGDVLIKYGSILTANDNVPRIKVEYENTSKAFLQKNDVIIADTAEDETVGKAVQVGDINLPLAAGLHTIPCRPIIPTASGYLGYYINCKAYHNQLLPYITGIKVSSISKSSIRNTEIHIPPLPEQQAIADTITALDNEINALETERDKIIQVRDGAMNDLLTGKVRLIHGN